MVQQHHNPICMDSPIYQKEQITCYEARNKLVLTMTDLYRIAIQFTRLTLVHTMRDLYLTSLTHTKRQIATIKTKLLLTFINTYCFLCVIHTSLKLHQW